MLRLPDPYLSFPKACRRTVLVNMIQESNFQVISWYLKAFNNPQTQEWLCPCVCARARAGAHAHTCINFFTLIFFPLEVVWRASWLGPNGLVCEKHWLLRSCKREGRVPSYQCNSERHGYLIPTRRTRAIKPLLLLCQQSNCYHI